MTTIRITYPSAVATDKGGCPYNQDRGFVNPATDSIGVFDGHGEFGHDAARRAAEVFSTAGAADPYHELFAAAEAAVTDSIRTAVALPMEEGGAYYRRGAFGARGAPVRGGTTASVVRVSPINGAVSVANVGDSDVVLFDSDTDPGTSLIADHSCTSHSEWLRVHASHPKTRFAFQGPSGYPERPVWLESYVLPIAEEASWKPNAADCSWTLHSGGGFQYCDVRGSWATYLHAADNSESLAMTRALGDLNLKRHGVSSEPAIQEAAAPLPGTTRVIVIGSDGLWDPLQYEEVRAIVRRPEFLGARDADGATAALMAYAKERAPKLMGPGYDNIACAVVYVAVEAAPAAETEPTVEDGRAAEVPAAAAAGGGQEEAVSVPPEAPAATGPRMQAPTEPVDPMAAAIAAASAAQLQALRAEYGAEAVQQILDCELHGPPARNPLGLWYSMNEAGHYGMFAPGCNGCVQSRRDAERAKWGSATAEGLTEKEKEE